jgi:hypothetical protein
VSDSYFYLPYRFIGSGLLYRTSMCPIRIGGGSRIHAGKGFQACHGEAQRIFCALALALEAARPKPKQFL